jgi:hypothetical protein
MLDEAFEEELIEEASVEVKEAVEVVIEGCNPVVDSAVCLLSVSDLVKED